MNNWYWKLKKNLLYYLRRLRGDKKIWHQDVMKYLKNIKNPVILEAGACDGQDTLRFAKLYPHATIYAFEPVKNLFEKIKQRVSGLDNVKLFQLALSDNNGESEMYISELKEFISSSSSLLAPAKHLDINPEIVFEKKEIVKTMTLDSWAEQEKIDRIDAMWLDMQGAEPVVLKASEKIIRTVKVICSEVSFIELYKDQILYDEYRKWLESLGFEVKKEEFFKNNEGGNVLFVRV